MGRWSHWRMWSLCKVLYDVASCADKLLCFKVQCTVHENRCGPYYLLQFLPIGKVGIYAQAPLSAPTAHQMVCRISWRRPSLQRNAACRLLQPTSSQQMPPWPCASCAWGPSCLVGCPLPPASHAVDATTNMVHCICKPRQVD